MCDQAYKNSFPGLQRSRQRLRYTVTPRFSFVSYFAVFQIRGGHSKNESKKTFSRNFQEHFRRL